MTAVLAFLLTISVGIAMVQNQRLRRARDRAVRRAEAAEHLTQQQTVRVKLIRRQRDKTATELEDALLLLDTVVAENVELRDQASRSLPAAPARTHNAEYLQAVADGAHP